jgi:hypothetical protein
MLYLSLFTPDERTAAEMSGPEHMEEMNELVEEMSAAGVLVARGAFLERSLGARVRSSQGKLTVSAAPAREPNDRVVGFAILNVKSKAEGIAMAEKFLKVAGDGECELRPLMATPPSR